MNRRKLIERISLGGLALAVPSAVYAFDKSENYMQTKSSIATNPALSSVPGTEQYSGTPLDQNGYFMNEEFPFWPSTKDVLKWKVIDSNPYKQQKENDSGRLEVVKHASLDNVSDNSIVWLGHASFLIQLNGVRILIDPIFGEPGFLFKRFSDLPFNTDQFKDIDYILISHNHRDHCDKDTIELLATQNPAATWLCGLGLDHLFLKDWTGSDKIQAAGWYQQYQIDNASLKISFLPTRHWSRRGLSDTNKSLWGAFMIESLGKRIYFGGDSGFGNHFRKVPELFGKVDFYLAGIGAFAPRWFMAPSHMHPEEAAKACNDIQPRNMLPMHFGTYDLSDEPLMEPARLIQELKENGAFDSNLVMPAVGEVLNI